MEQSVTLFIWFSSILLIAIVVIDTLLGLKFQRYFRANGFGVVTITLLSLIVAHAVGAILFGITSLTIIFTSGTAEREFYIMKDVGTVWLISSTLLHVIGITFQRVFSFSYGNAFLQFTRSKTNISLLITTIWIASLIMTALCVTSNTPSTYAVFYVGLFVTGFLAILNFVVTVETSLYRDQAFDMEFEGHIQASCTKVRVVQNPRKTFSLFSGLVFLFILFCLPTSIPNLIFNFQGKLLSQSTSLVISLWLLLGVVFDCMWVLMRLRSTVNDTSGFFARWTLGKSKDNLPMFFRSKRENDTKLLHSLDDSVGKDTEHEHV